MNKQILTAVLFATTFVLHTAQAQPNPAWGGRTRVALANNPAANEWMIPPTVNRRFKQAVDAGVNYVYLSPKWNELETSPGKFKFKDIDFQAEQAEKANLPLILQLRVIDTNRKSTPSDLVDVPFDDPRMQARLFALLDQLAPHLKHHVSFSLFGNEVDSYFSAHRAELPSFVRLFHAASSRLKEQFDGAPVSVSIAFDGLQQVNGSLRPLLSQTDFLALTYYPMRPDFTVKPTVQIAADVRSIVNAAGPHKVLLQEVGYPSSSLNSSSEEMQAGFIHDILTSVAAAHDKFIGINFLFMCDFSDKLTQTLAANYDLPNAARFRSFLQTLGLFDGKGQPKKSWSVFQRDVPSLTK